MYTTNTAHEHLTTTSTTVNSHQPINSAVTNTNQQINSATTNMHQPINNAPDYNLAQIKINLRYSFEESRLYVTLDQCKNLTTLSIPQHSTSV